jgi:hypothetical protein
MGSFSLVHWIVYLLVTAIFLVPVALILKKAGYSGWLALLGMVPLVNIVCLWVFALVRWPTKDQTNV